MRNARLEQRLIRRKIRMDNQLKMFAGYINEVNRSAERDHLLVGPSSTKGWAIFWCLFVVLGIAGIAAGQV